MNVIIPAEAGTQFQVFLNKSSSLSLALKSAAPENFPDCLNLKKSQKLERLLSKTLSA